MDEACAPPTCVTCSVTCGTADVRLCNAHPFCSFFPLFFMSICVVGRWQNRFMSECVHCFYHIVMQNQAVRNARAKPRTNLSYFDRKVYISVEDSGDAVVRDGRSVRSAPPGRERRRGESAAGPCAASLAREQGCLASCQSRMSLGILVPSIGSQRSTNNSEVYCA